MKERERDEKKVFGKRPRRGEGEAAKDGRILTFLRTCRHKVHKKKGKFEEGNLFTLGTGNRPKWFGGEKMRVQAWKRGGVRGGVRLGGEGSHAKKGQLEEKAPLGGEKGGISTPEKRGRLGGALINKKRESSKEQWTPTTEGTFSRKRGGNVMGRKN